ncbi:MAG TPA: hypothetical protein VF447_13665 [Terriglobales bacterium]
MNLRQQITLAHERDAAWIIALWKFVHGGDPGPERVAAEVIAAMVPYLNGAADTLSFEQLEKQFATLGAQVTETEMADARIEGTQPRPRQYCFKFKGQTICIQLPQIKNVAVAA